MSDPLIFRFVTCISLLSISLCVPSAQGAPKSNETDLASLLEFKSRVTDDPDQVFSSWNDTVDLCHWPGIMCGRRHSRVIRLVLRNLRLGGSLSPYIGNLSFLSVLVLDNNRFTGEIPPESGKLRRLIYLRLQNNSFSGQIPENISRCVNLRVITLKNSNLVGEVPRDLATLSGLQTFDIYGNKLTGGFPECFGNLSSLRYISAASNNFSGAVPASLGRLQALKGLFLGANSFSGVFPHSIFNITSLEDLDFVQNQLEGGLSSNNTLPNLMTFNFAFNHFTGPFPPLIANAANLRRISIASNNFSGLVPDFKNLNQLEWLIISDNHLGRGVNGDLRFIESLNSTKLQDLSFSINNFGGALPLSIGNLSASLNVLLSGSNHLTGAIPSSIGNLRDLESLSLEKNRVTGSLPEEIGHLHKLKVLLGWGNGFSGEIPSSIGNLTMLMTLQLTGNNFEGNIPKSLGNCQNLIELELDQNNLSGTIPSQVLSLSSLAIVLDLSMNKLSGYLPDEIGGLNNLAALYVHDNRLSGRVPNTLGRCTSLMEMYMGNNLFDGNISSFLSPLKGLQYLDLSQNNFSGGIPKFLEDFHLTYLNLSFNHFEGEVPNQGVFLNATGISVIENDKLCGGISALNLPNCPTPKSKSRRKISTEVIITTASGVAVLFVVLLLLATYICLNRTRRRNIKPQSGLMPRGPFFQISYEDILRATEGFNQNNLIGAGSFGSVYKGILGDGYHVVAIKVLNLQTRVASKSFVAECEALRNIRHRNLVKISTCCSTIDFQGNEFKALVYEYMENGSLEEWLYPQVASAGLYRKLSLIHRLSIAIDIACAVEYLHYESETSIIHCDLKPSNVLLDVEMTAHVGDFGLAKILSSAEVISQVSSVGVRGTIGYIPPEYGMGSEVTREGDVYSHGILLLEMFTGKRPTDDMFEDAWNIRSYCEAAFPERVVEIADPSLFSNEFGEGSSIRAPGRMIECLTKAFEVGIGCCRELPGERMDIREAAAKLRALKL